MIESILFVDDDENTRDVMKTIFSILGITTRIASNGLEAIEKMKEKPSEIIFLDVEMPVMNGIDACKKIRSLYPHSAIVIMTGKELTNDEMEIIKSDANAYFTKPVDVALLLCRLQQMSRDFFYHAMHGDPSSRFKTRLYTERV